MHVQYAMDAGKAWIADCYASIDGLNGLNALPGAGYLLTTPKANQPVRKSMKTLHRTGPAILRESYVVATTNWRRSQSDSCWPWTELGIWKLGRMCGLRDQSSVLRTENMVLVGAGLSCPTMHSVLFGLEYGVRCDENV